MKTTRCKDDNNVIQILEAHSFASCWKMYEWLDRIHRSRLNRISGYASFRPYLPAVSRGINGPGASYINSTRSCWRIIWNDASWLRTRSPSLSLALALHTRTFRVRACAQISANNECMALAVIQVERPGSRSLNQREGLIMILTQLIRLSVIYRHYAVTSQWKKNCARVIRLARGRIFGKKMERVAYRYFEIIFNNLIINNI